jgi:hypothetical protein
MRNANKVPSNRHRKALPIQRETTHLGTIKNNQGPKITGIRTHSLSCAGAPGAPNIDPYNKR